MPDATTTTEGSFSPFTHTPDEIIGQITEHLDFQDRLSLSSTCWRFRLALGSEFFKVTKFSNTELHAKMIHGLVRSNANILVKELHFVGRAPTDKSDKYYATSFIMPGEVHAILTDVSQFPNIEKLIVEFDFNFEMRKWKSKLCDLFSKSNIEEALSRESSVAWKALTARTFEAIIGNRIKGILKNLEIRSLPPLIVSTYWNLNWRIFLSKLEHLSISIWGGDCCATKKVLSAQGYRWFIKNMDWAYFSRLTNLTTLEFRPSISGMVTGQSMADVLWNDVAFPLEASHMRKLRHLTFRNTFLSVEMLDFVVSHAATLESLRFENCFAYEEHPQGNVHRVGPSWQELFTALTESRASRLRAFELVGPELPTPAGRGQPGTSDGGNNNNVDDDEGSDGGDDDDDEDPNRESDRKRMQAKTAVARRAARPGARYFAYGHLSNKAGLVRGWDFALRHLEQGRDLEAYNGLMGLVHANALELPTRLHVLAAKYASSMSFISARPANLKPSAAERPS